MKNAKKVFAMLIVLALAISMAIPASAGSITITGVNKDVKVDYRLWQMATLTFSAGEQAGTADDTYAYTATDAWVDFFSTGAAAGYFDFDSKSKAVTKTNAYDDSAAATVADLALKYVKSKSLTPTKTTSSAVNATTAVFSGVDNGFYLVDSTLGTKLILDSVVGDLSISTKNTAPTLDKKIVVDEDTKVKSDDVEIGKPVNFEITITKQAGAVNYVVEDTLSKGLTFTAGSAMIKLADGAAKAITPDIAVVEDEQQLTFTVEGEENIADGASIVITYSAVLNDSALIDRANTNTAVLKYGNNATYTTEPSTTNTYTWSFDLVKYSNSKADANKLPGATFSLYEVDPFAAGNKDAQPLKFFLVDGQYRLAADQNSTNANIKNVFTDTNGTYDIAGLDSGKTYYLKEVAAPAGYNVLTTATPVTISTNGTTATTLTNNTAEVSVINNTGTELPQTGATGTIIFITVGGLMVVAMGVLLVVRKRMSKVVYTR